MAQYFTDYSGDSLGGLPENTTLKRNSVAGDYQVVDDADAKVLRFGRTSGTANARGLGYTGITSVGRVELYASIKDPITNPASGRLIAYATDSPDNEYGCYMDRSTTDRITVYKRVAGSFTSIATFSLSLSNDYWSVRFSVTPGSPNLLKAKAWLSTASEPALWGIETTDTSFDLISGSQVGGWIGHVGFDDTPFISYKEMGIGNNGDAAPTDPVTGGVTLSVDSISLSVAMDSATLTQANQLTVDDLQCQTSLDAGTLQQANVISPDEITLTSQLDSAVLVSAGQLSVNDLQLTMDMETALLQQANQLSVDSLLLTTTFESPDLSIGLTLIPDSIWLSALLDQVALTQSHLLTVDDLTQSISLDNVTLTLAGQVIGPGTLTIGITGPSISIGISP